MEVGALLRFLSILVDALLQEQLDVFTLRLIEKLGRKKAYVLFPFVQKHGNFSKFCGHFFFFL